MNIRRLFEDAIESARDWHAHLPEAREFCPWPDDLAWKERPAHALPSARLVAESPGAAIKSSMSLAKALGRLVPRIEWRHKYAEEEVGRDFLDRYCWFELAGPDGHFISGKARMTVGYRRTHLHYPRHQRAPEELYTVLSGQATFHSDGEEDETLDPEGVRMHRVNQPHAPTTGEMPVPAFELWRGDNLASEPGMTK
ncbi:MAG: dimethylsulfonioproprionate lyase family protein [Roseovarius sp.]|nr:dimethylsulfonioproprionate lyase family protein [Roseovarius sp.]